MRQGNTAKTIKIYFSLLILMYLVMPGRVAAEVFKIVVLPDTQRLSDILNDGFLAQTQWIKDQINAGEKIIFVSHVGDIIQCRPDPQQQQQWGKADTAMKELEPPNTPDSFRYGVLPGNHDYDYDAGNPDSFLCFATDTINYNTVDNVNNVINFGPGRFSALGTDYGTYDDTNDNNYVLFESDEIQFIAINLAYSTTGNAFADTGTETVLQWADRMLKEHPERMAIISAHFIVDGFGPNAECVDGARGDQYDFGLFGRAMWEELKDNPNLFLMLSGHCFGEKWITIPGGTDERPCAGDVHVLLANYQEVDDPANSGFGSLRIMEFNTDENKVDVKTFSPISSTFGTDICTAGCDRSQMNRFSYSNFSFPINDPEKSGVALLLDTSGSMSWTVDGDTGFPGGVPEAEQRITFAKDSAIEFLELLNVFGANQAKFGIATFPHQATPGCIGQEVTAMTPINSGTKDTAINNTIPNLDTRNGTPLLAGMQSAIDMFNDEHQCAIVFLSDGYHNCPSTVSTGDDSVIALRDQLISNNIKVYTVGFGRPSDPDYPLLEFLATGQFYDVTDDLGFVPGWDAATALNAAYKSILTDELKLDLSNDPIGEVTSGEVKFFLDHITEHDRKVSFYLSWRTHQRDRLSLKILDSSDTQVRLTEPGVSLAQGETYYILTVDEEYLSKPGRVGTKPWRVDIVTTNIPATEKEPFQYSMILDSALKMKAALDRQSYSAGDTITLSARLTEAGRPLTGLSEVTVKVSTPEDGKGNWLSTNDVSADQLKKIPAQKGEETLAPFLRKADYLTDIKGVAFPGRDESGIVTLYDDGSHGDVTANDGRYTNRFRDTGKEGVYSFYFRADGTTQGENTFNRESLVQEYLTVRTVSEAILIDVDRLGAGDLKQFDVQATPKDALGNYLGPGHSGLVRFSATGGGGAFTGSLKDNLDGSYSQTLNVPLTTDEKDVLVTVKVDEASKDFNLGDELETYAFSIHVGQTSPSGNFGSLYDPDIHLGLDIEFPLKTRLAAIGELQYSRFEAAQSGVSDTYWLSLSGGLKYVLSPGTWQPFVTGSLGAYSPRSGSTDPGVHVGLGLDRKLNQRWKFEIGAGYHNIFTSGKDTEYSVIRAGLIFQL